jgi:hypothetical protein
VSKPVGRKSSQPKKRDNESIIIVAVIGLVGTLLVAILNNPTLNDWMKGKISTPTLVQEMPAQNLLPTEVPWKPQVSVTPISPTEATFYLKKVFTMWTIAGYLGDYPKTLSAFHSLLILNGDTDPIGTMQAWIEESKQMAVDAIPGTTVADYQYFEFNLSLNYELIGLEESYYVLWDHVSHDTVVENKPSNMAAIRLALIASVGETRQQQLIGEWNTLVQ